MENNNPNVRETDAARQGEVVFDPPWKRKVFIASVAGTAIVAAIVIFVVI